MCIKSKIITLALCALIAGIGLFCFGTDNAQAQSTNDFSGLSTERLQQRIVDLQLQISQIKQLIAQKNQMSGGTNVSQAPIGFFDTATCSTFTGWTCDADNYNVPLMVNFYADGQYGQGGVFVGATLAYAIREAAVGGRCNGNVNHGFNLTTTDRLKDGKSHTIYAYSIDITTGTMTLLATNAKTIQCAATGATACTPRTCASLNYNCGFTSDGCGGTLNCGTCASGQACANGACTTGFIYQAACSPNTWDSINCARCNTSGVWGQSCSDWGAGGTTWCACQKKCTGASTCASTSSCVPNCTNKTCGDNGCGGSCGDCAGGQTCVNNSCSAETGYTVTAGNNAQFVSQSVPSSMTAGQQYSVSVTVKNTGSTIWTASGNYRLGSQNPQDNLTWNIGRILLATDESVVPGQNKTFSFSVKAPATAGSYNFQWKMVQDGVQWFGDFSVNTVISVTSSSTTCNPNCANKTCGDNGCGGSCGTCAGGQTCSNGTCVTNTSQVPVGNFDTATCSSFTGWACDPDNYNTPLTVNFYANGQYGQGGVLVGTALANKGREWAVGNRCGGNTFHGFVWDSFAGLSATGLFDGRDHEIHAYAVDVPTGANALLPQRAWTIHCSGF